jgi:general stress protein 26
MTNYNDNPYSDLWFATFRQTKKVEQVQSDPRVKVKFPSSSEGEFYEIAGTAKLGSEEEVRERWRWWMLF